VNEFPMERRIIKNVLNFGRILGFCPIKRTNQGYKIKFCSWSGAWCILVATFYVLYALIIIPVRFDQILSAFSGKSKFHNFTSKTAALVLIVLPSAGYTSYILWLISLPKLLRFWNGIESYDFRFNIAPVDNRAFISFWKNLSVLLVALMGNGLFLGMRADPSLAYVEKSSGSSWSLLAIARSEQEATKMFISAENFFRSALAFITYTTILLFLVVISTRAELITKTIDQVLDTFGSISEPQNSCFLIECCSNVEKKKASMLGKSNGYWKMVAQIRSLNELFLAFSSAIEMILLFNMTFGVAMLSMLTFIISHMVFMSNSPFNARLISYILLHLALSMRMVILSNGGEALDESVRTNKLKLLNIV